MRLNVHKSLAMLCLVGSCLIGTAARAQDSQGEFNANEAERNPGLETTRLEDQLINGLRTVTPEQRQYVMQIVALVVQGKLPRTMVSVVYTWALKRNPSVPLPYFQIALRALAERRGIVVP
jgi:hypothetical protein